jgi:hypothetical protein
VDKIPDSKQTNRIVQEHCNSFGSKSAGKNESSFVSKRLLECSSEPALHAQEEDELKHAAGGMYTAGSETVSTIAREIVQC